MSSCRIYFEGNIRGLEKALILKLETSSLTVKKISDQVALVQSDLVDLIDQIFYIKGNEIVDGIVITNVEEATENDKTTASNMGFEVINREDTLSNTTTTSKLLDDNVNSANTVVEKVESKSNENVFDRKTAENNLAQGIMDAIPNSKTPLRKEDPFYFVLQKNFLVYASLGASALVFLGSMF